MAKITISRGNSKMGDIPSISLPPVITCAPGCTCAKYCYAVKLCRIYKNVKASYERNYNAWVENPIEYFNTVNNTIKKSPFFRFHVSGDIPTYDYFVNMVKSAKNNPHCEILAFTKQYDTVNTYIDNSPEKSRDAIPANLHIIFSHAEGFPMDNRYNFPVSVVVFKDTVVNPAWIECGGNCKQCAISKSGCFGLRPGDIVWFKKH